MRFLVDIMLTVYNCLTVHFFQNDCDKCTGYASFGGTTIDEVVVVGEKLGKPASRNVKRKQTNTRLALGKLQVAPQGAQSKKYDSVVIIIIIMGTIPAEVFTMSTAKDLNTGNEKKLDNFVEILLSNIGKSNDLSFISVFSTNLYVLTYPFQVTRSYHLKR